MAKHAPAILLSYVRTVADPTKQLPSETRRLLLPGLHCLCDVIAAGRGTGMRGREGEMVGVPFGLGEGLGGDAEREVWAHLWQAWGRRRYRGEG